MILRWLGLSHDTNEVAVSERDWRSLRYRSPLLQCLSEDELQRLRQLSEEFLARKTISACNGWRPTPWRELVLAAHSCLPILHLGRNWLEGWRELIVYPGQFRVRRHEQGEDGVVQEWEDEVAGEAWERGPVVVSWADVLADLRWPQPGFNVIVHEIAHKLDGRSGAMDGMPPLPRARRRAWISAFQSAFEHLNAELERGAETAIDPYAAESPDEFFAVASEYHFTAPQHLQRIYPDVAAQLRAFYGPPPLRPLD